MTEIRLARPGGEPTGIAVATYRIDFEPYGWGQGGPSRGRLVVYVLASKPTDAGATKLGKQLQGTNVAVWVEPGSAKVVSAGGAYSGVLQVQPQGDVGLFYLSEVTARK